MGWWNRRRSRDDGAERPPAAASPAASPRQAASPAGPRAVADLTEEAGWTQRIERDPERVFELFERRRARKAQAEAQRDLRRLRARHWSGERLIEEGRTVMEWWEHPEADPYAVLGVLPGDSLEAAAAARRCIALACHPDRVGGGDESPDAALRRMIAANAAYDRLRRALLSA